METRGRLRSSTSSLFALKWMQRHLLNMTCWMERRLVEVWRGSNKEEEVDVASVSGSEESDWDLDLLLELSQH